MQLDLGNEKALSAKVESARAQLDKKCKETKLRLTELEELARKGNKTQVATLESQVCRLYHLRCYEIGNTALKLLELLSPCLDVNEVSCRPRCE